MRASRPCLVDRQVEYFILYTLHLPGRQAGRKRKHTRSTGRPHGMDESLVGASGGRAEDGAPAASDEHTYEYGYDMDMMMGICACISI